MQKTLFRRIGSGLLSLLMMSTLAISPTLAADSRSESAAVSTQAASDFTITPVGTVTADSTQVTLRIDCADTEVSTVNVFLLPVNTYGYNEDNPIAKKKECGNRGCDAGCFCRKADSGKPVLREADLYQR